MTISFKPPFRKFVKKQTRPFQLAIEDEVDSIINNPFSNEVKRGDLYGFRVKKFIFRGQQFLISYIIELDELTFYSIAPHENFYRDLKRYLREVG
jgi:hypothetical protein